MFDLRMTDRWQPGSRGVALPALAVLLDALDAGPCGRQSRIIQEHTHTKHKHTHTCTPLLDAGSMLTKLQNVPHLVLRGPLRFDLVLDALLGLDHVCHGRDKLLLISTKFT